MEPGHHRLREGGGHVGDAPDPPGVVGRANAHHRGWGRVRCDPEGEAVGEEPRVARGVVVDVEPPLAVGVGAVEGGEAGGVGARWGWGGPGVTRLVVGRPVGRRTADVGAVPVGHGGRRLIVPHPPEGFHAERAAGVGHQDHLLALRSDQQQVEVVGVLVPDAVDGHVNIGDQAFLPRDGSGGRVEAGGAGGARARDRDVDGAGLDRERPAALDVAAGAVVACIDYIELPGAVCEVSVERVEAGRVGAGRRR